MGFEIEVDTSNIDADDLDAGTVRVAGWFKAMVHDVTEKENGGWDFVYKVTAGPHKNGTIFDTLWDPSMAEDADKAQTATKRILLVAKRLGLWDGQKRPGLKINLAEAVNRECFLKLTDQSYTDKKTNQFRHKVGVGWGDIYALTDERVPQEVREGKSGPGTAGASAKKTPSKPGSGSASAPAAPTTPAAPAKPARDYSNL